jgi:hypothetical protein
MLSGQFKLCMAPMLIVKPYGRSSAEPDAYNEKVRRLKPRDEEHARKYFPSFAQSHDELLIAQWISIVDKIASKPGPRKLPTREQRVFRKRLGAACWSLIESKNLLPGTQDAQRRAHLRELWETKIEPYGDGEFRPKGRNPPLPPSPKGRWFSAFAGDTPVERVDVAEVARKIFRHLYVEELRIDGGARKGKSGLIAARAHSIANNVLKPAAAFRSPAWGYAEMARYVSVGDVAQAIVAAARRREEGTDGCQTKRVTLDLAGKALFEHYGRLFQGGDGKVQPLADVKNTPLFALHQAVKDCYRSLLGRQRKDGVDARAKDKAASEKGAPLSPHKVSKLLPKDSGELFARIAAMGTNRDLAAMVRLGRIIHYEANLGDTDTPMKATAKFPDQAMIDQGRYWTSEEQANIKRNEAYVRIWRHVLTLAGRTLWDWADPRGAQGEDILGARRITELTGGSFDPASYARKLPLLFGSRARLFPAGLESEVLRFALEGVAALRNNAFHFKGLGGFATAFKTLHETKGPPASVLTAIGALWDEDAEGRASRLRDTLRSAFCPEFLDEAQNRALLSALESAPLVPLPLPRFSRLLERAEAWTGADSLGLPESANRLVLEVAERRCQYVALKLLYERPFRAWFEERDTRALNTWIGRAVGRATQEAQELNGKRNPKARDLIVARAASLGSLAESERVESFFFKLSAATASEMRVQRGYASDGERAREQAEYIEKLKCDVTALAYVDYLKESGFGYLTRLPSESQRRTPVDLDRVAKPVQRRKPADWQAALYFLLHLVPVDDVGRLLHQIRKWDILGGSGTTLDAEASRLQEVLELYLEMHDAKFEGGGDPLEAGEFSELFERKDHFHKLFAAQPGDVEDRRIPRRGLREIMRFGHWPILRRLRGSNRVSARDVETYLRMESLQDGRSGIADAQARREALHEQWVESGKELSPADLREYVEALNEVGKHRQLAGRVTLTDHVRAHRLLMSVLGRLVDYSGLWERDLYFVTLAAIFAEGTAPDKVLTAKGCEFLQDGQIVKALRNWEKSATALRIKDVVARFFGPVWDDGDRNTQIRNDFAHFNVLKAGAARVNLTHCVENARDLMAYDRKLKNAVSQSVKELLAREGVDLLWEVDSRHRFHKAVIRVRQARHLDKKDLFEFSKPGEKRKHGIFESLHGDGFTAMVADLFGGDGRARRSSLDLPLDKIDWTASAESRKNSRAAG